MNIDKMIEQWEEKHSSLLNEYSKGNVNNEVMQMYRSQMKNVLDFINQLKQVKNCFIPGVSGSDVITLTRDELNVFLQDWSAGYSAEEQYLSWDEKSLKIVNFLGLNE